MTSTDAEVDNIDRVKKGFEAFAASDMASLSELFDADARWRGDPTGILAGNYDGRDAIFAMFAQVGQETAGTFRSIPSTMAASGDKVFREVRLYQVEHAQNAAFWA